MEKTMSDYQILNQPQPNYPVNQVPRNLVTVTQIVYFLHGLSIVLGVFSGASIATAFVFGWPSIIAVIINYVKRGDVQGTYLASHFTWQIRTFWYAFWWIIFCVGGRILLSLHPSWSGSMVYWIHRARNLGLLPNYSRLAQVVRWLPMPIY